MDSQITVLSPITHKLEPLPVSSLLQLLGSQLNHTGKAQLPLVTTLEKDLHCLFTPPFAYFTFHKSLFHCAIASLLKMEVPDQPDRVELTGPSCDMWIWGPEEAKNMVKGQAEDFCLVVVQRRHVADTDLIIHGETAQQWMSIAQAYAGPPTEARKPGKFLKSKQ